jgi:putative Holliday junction resolvase
MKYLGIDYGNKKIGLAISEGDLPSAFKTLDTKGSIAQIKNICANENIEVVVIGKPALFLKSSFSKFLEGLEKEISAEIFVQDETLSSKYAQSALLYKSKKNRNKSEHEVAAALILENYLKEK